MAATQKERHTMTPLIPDKALFAVLFGALALVLAAPAGARPIISDSELGDAPASVVPAKPDLEHSVLAKGSVAVAPDAFERAVTSQAPTTSGTVVLHKSGAVVTVGQDAEPAWLKALNARSEAMNAYYGAGTSTTVRPDDRANPRPVATHVAVRSSGTDSADDGIAWGDVAAGALGGFGIALLLGLGGFAVIHSHRRTGPVAH
jgi:hypothetical protein